MSDVAFALGDICSSWRALAPPNLMRVSEGASKNLKIVRPGGATGFWNPLETPYMVEPVDMLGSRVHKAVCFVGPSQSGKTVGLGEGWLAHAVVNDPGDMLIAQMTQDKAREYSKQRIDRAIKNSPALQAMRSAMSRDDNLHDKQFKNGMWLRIAWPTGTNFSSTSYRYVFGTDYDRWNQGREDVDGEGDGFGLMLARIRTFLSRGKVCVESSPGREIVDPTWRPTTPHEAPPVGTPETGAAILGIYNRGDRRRYYWPCPHCGFRFQAEPGLRLFNLDPLEELLEGIRELDIDTYARQHARIACPECGAIITPVDREAMNLAGRWLAEGLTLDEHGRVSGNPRKSDIASYWLGGIAATYQSWPGLVRSYLNGLLTYAMTGDELPLQTTVNTDQSMPYMRMSLLEAADLAKKGSVYERGLPRYIVPEWARFLIAAVDVQGGRNARFVVQVHAVGEHQRQQVIDRFELRESMREGMGAEFAPIDPGGHPEDWDVLTEKVLAATYRTTVVGRELAVHRAIVDTGGEAGVTDNAYRWARRVRKLDVKLFRKLLLSKGTETKVDYHVRETSVGGTANNGDLTLYLLNSNLIKDALDNALKRREVGPNYYHWPEPRPSDPDGWLSQAFYDELKAEVRLDTGKWSQIKPRNETWDCCYMIRAACNILGVDKRNFWTSPPAWALPLTEGNAGLVTPEERREVKEEVKREAPKVLQRQQRRSGYMG